MTRKREGPSSRPAQVLNLPVPQSQAWDSWGVPRGSEHQGDHWKVCPRSGLGRISAFHEPDCQGRAAGRVHLTETQAMASCEPRQKRQEEGSGPGWMAQGRFPEEGSATVHKCEEFVWEREGPGWGRRGFSAAQSTVRASMSSLSAQGTGHSLLTPERPGVGSPGRWGGPEGRASAGTPWRHRLGSAAAPAARRPGPTRRW